MKHIAKGTFGYHVLTLAGGTLAGQIILFVSLPFLQRYFYGPEAFGLFTIYVSISELLIDVAGLKYEYGIVRMKRGKDAINLMILSFFCVLAVTLLCALVFLALYLFFPEINFVKDLGIYLFIIPLSVLFFGSTNTLGYWFNRQQQYNAIAKNKLSSSLVSEPVKFAWAATIKANGLGLIWGRVLGQLAGFLYAFSVFIKHHKKQLKLFSKPTIQKLAFTQKRYPLFVLPSTLITILITAIYVQFFLSYFGKEKVGLLGVSVSYIGVAFGIMSGAIGQVFYRKIASTNDFRALRKLYIKFTQLLFIPSIIAIILAYAIPSSFVSMALGERWAEIIPIARIMVPWMGIAFVSSSLSFMHIHLDTQNKLLFIDVIHLIGVLAALYGGYYYIGTFYGVLVCFAVAQAIHYILVILAAIYFLNQRIKSDIAV